MRTRRQESTGILLEKSSLLLCALPTQNRIPLRKPPKLDNRITMRLCMRDTPSDVVAGEVIVGELAPGDQRFRQRNARDLRHDRLVVHQWQVEEERLYHGHAIRICVYCASVDVLVELASDRRHRHLACLCVRGVRLVRVTIDVAGELIEQQDEREAALRGVGPVVELVGACLRHERAKLGADLFVEALAAAEPFLAGFTVREPKGQDRVDFGIHLDFSWCS